MPDVTQADIGRRMYQLDKEKNVERAIGMLRQSLGPDWKVFPDADIHLLERLIGDVWVGFDRKLWEKIPFDQMTREDVLQILEVGKNIELDKTPRTQVLEKVQEVLQALR